MIATQPAQPRIVLIDIETSPNLSYTWGRYEQDVIEVVRDWYIIGFAWKWVGEKKVHTKYLCDYKQKDIQDDSQLAHQLREVLDAADVVVAHYGDGFDLPKINARLAVHGLTPPSPYKSIDTKKVAKKYFAFDSNHLNDLGGILGLGHKASSGGFTTWKGCMAGDKKSFATMRKYNIQDILLLEKLYLKFLPWISPHPNHNVFTQQNGCPNCGNKHVQSRGFSVTATGRKQRYQCVGKTGCGAWSHGAIQKITSIEIR